MPAASANAARQRQGWAHRIEEQPVIIAVLVEPRGRAEAGRSGANDENSHLQRRHCGLSAAVPALQHFPAITRLTRLTHPRSEVPRARTASGAVGSMHILPTCAPRVACRHRAGRPAHVFRRRKTAVAQGVVVALARVRDC